MLGDSDAALIISDNALLADPRAWKKSTWVTWTTWTGLPFVYAFWAGRAGVLNEADIEALQQARDAGVLRPDEIAREYFRDAPAHQAIGARYLRDNIQYSLDGALEGLTTFYRYAAKSARSRRPVRCSFLNRE
jgi:chorismate dehydratase